MYDIKKIIGKLDNEFNWINRGENLFAGRIDEDMFSDDQFAIMINNDVIIKSEPSSFGTYNTQYEKDSLRIIFKCSRDFYGSNEKINEIYNYFRKNKSIPDIGIIQTNPNKPYAMSKIKGNVNKYNMFLDIIYKI